MGEEAQDDKIKEEGKDEIEEYYLVEVEDEPEEKKEPVTEPEVIKPKETPEKKKRIIAKRKTPVTEKCPRCGSIELKVDLVHGVFNCLGCGLLFQK